jgi:hypothetical protein
LENFKLFHHFKVEPDSIRAEYFENSIYYTNYEVKFTAKTKKPDKVGSKRSLEEVEDETLKSIDYLGKRMKKMQTQFNQVESEEIDLMEALVKEFKNLSMEENISGNNSSKSNDAIEIYFKKIDTSITKKNLKQKIASAKTHKNSEKYIASKNLTYDDEVKKLENFKTKKKTQLATPQARATTHDAEPAFDEISKKRSHEILTYYSQIENSNSTDKIVIKQSKKQKNFRKSKKRECVIEL